MNLTLSFLLLACASIFTAAQDTAQNSNCSIFSWDQQPAYLINDTTRARVSAAETCPSRSNVSHACPIEATGDLDAQWQVNISGSVLRDYYYITASGGSSFYFDLVNRTIPSANTSSTGIPFRNYVVGNINTIQQLTPGTSGYLEFVRVFQCYAGTLSNCTANTIADGTPVEFCAPVFHNTGGSSPITILDGNYFVKEVNASQVGQYPNPFAGQSRGAASTLSLSMGLMGLVSAAMMLMLVS